MHTISVIVPIYNNAKYLPKCLDSLLAQTYRDLEIILVNDGSTDGTFQICEAYRQKDSRIKVISQPNSGCSAARNRGIEMASGTYISFVDGDDWVEDNYFERLVSVHEETGSDVTITNFVRFEEETSVFHFYTRKEDSYVKEYKPEEWFQHMFGIENHSSCFVTAWGKLYNRKLFRLLRYPVGKIAEDDYTTFYTYLMSQKIAYINEPLYVYRTNQSSISGTNKLADRIPLASIEEAITMMTILGIDTTAAIAIFKERLRLQKGSYLVDGRVDEYNHVSMMIELLEKNHKI